MKKTVLLFIIMLSFSFANTAPSYIVLGSSVYKKGAIITNKDNMGGSSPYYAISANFGTYLEVCEWTPTSGDGYNATQTCYTYNSSNDCSAPKSIVDGECVTPPPSEPANCNNFAGQYSSSSGQCEDCSSFGDNVSGRASCACAAMGSSYVPQSVIPVFSESSGGKTYEKRDAKCENGSSVPVYTNAVDTPKDTNGTSPTNPTNPADNNSTNPTDPTNPSNPSDNNNTNPTTPSQSDVVNAVKDATDKTLKAINETNTATKAVDLSVKAVDTSVQAVNSTLQSSNTKLDSMVAKLSDSNSLLKDSKDIQSDTKALLTQEFKDTKAFRENLDTRLKNLIDASLDNGSQLSHINTNVASTTNAVNAQGDKISGKLDDLLKAIKDSNGSGKKDGNGTDMKPTNDLLEKIKGETNATAKGVDKLHDDLNTTNDILGKIKGMFDNNNSFKTPDVNESEFELSDLLPENNWFETNKLKLNFNNYGGGCYCQTAEFSVAGHTFVFPPQEALDVIPFDVISKIFMAFIYVLGLRDFLRN